MSTPRGSTGPNPMTPPECSLDCGCRWDEECPECGGDGYLEPEWAMQGDTQYPCDSCHGTGRVPGECDR